jgi:SAM-dependent methyltransferase
MSQSAAVPSGFTDDHSFLSRSFLRLLLIGFLGSCLMPLALTLPDRSQMGGTFSAQFLSRAGLLAAAAVVLTTVLYYVLKKLEGPIDLGARMQVRFLDNFPVRYVDLGIFGSAALSLLLELAIIRWQSTIFEFFAFYKNFSLLACFIGLGIGYALASRNRIPMALVLPCLAWQFGFMTFLRYGMGASAEKTLHSLPFREQLAMGTARTLYRSPTLALYGLLTVVFLITTLCFIPVGQLCGRLMERRTKLRAYGLNLLGSLLGVGLMLAASSLWTPPLVWFAVCFLGLVLFQERRAPVLVLSSSFALVCAIILSWPVNPLWNRIYSPYQLLELGHNDQTGLTLIRAAGNYYQRIYDFSGNNSRQESVRKYYELPYQIKPQPANVAVVGAGTGNDVAAALRRGAWHIEAIEIDPAILMTGRANHPEKPYSNPRVHAVINDARSFLRNTHQKFDVIVYGMLDSHTLLSQGSSVRLDSFVYTMEGLREARARLLPKGLLALSFSVLSDELGNKIYRMLQGAFDGRPPMCVRAGYDNSVVFLESNQSGWTLPPQTLARTGFSDITAVYANPALQSDVSTDDWPFFYMPRRIYPTSYLILVFQILILSFLVTRNFMKEGLRWEGTHLSFFFLGAGFMLIETKGITEMGLTFGNTWEVIGIVIASILVMAFFGNCAVQWLHIRKPLIPYLCLWATLAMGWIISGSGGFASTPAGRLEAAIVLTSPLFFSGIVFSTLLTSYGQVSNMMGMNLLGATCGGLLEYNSMYFGFRSLYVAAAACYLLAFAADLVMSYRSSSAALHRLDSVKEVSV